MDVKRALALTLGLTLILSFATSTTSQSTEAREDGDVPAVPEVLTETGDALGDIKITRETLVEPVTTDITESSVCTCEQVGKKDEQVKRAKDQDLVEENLVIEKKSGKSFDVITITIPNSDKKQKSKVETLANTFEPETIALDDNVEEDVKEDEGVVRETSEKSTTAKVEEEPEADTDTIVGKKIKGEKVKVDKKSLKSSEKKRTKRTTNKGGKRQGKKGKGKTKGKRR